MTKTKSTKRALLLSALSLLMCVSMLVGSTFAWFTDSVTSGNNKIQAGTLQIDLELLEEDGSWTSIKDSNKAIFDYRNWEPGYTDVKVLKVTNEGTLALKWLAKFVSANELTELAEVIDVYVNTEVQAYPTNRTNLDGWTPVGTVADFVNDISETTYGTLEAGDSAYLGIALKMQESAGNKYQGMDLGGAFDIQIVATQYTSESDSFDNQYDADAEMPGRVATTEEKNALVAAIKNAEDGSTIYLDALDYGEIKLQQYATTPDLPDNITIVGDASARINLKIVKNAKIANGYNITGWTFKNVVFTGTGFELMTGASADGVTFEKCVFGTGTNLFIHNTSGGYGKDVKVSDCTFYGNGFSAVLVQSGTNVTVDGCTFVDAGHNAIQVTNAAGEIIISNNDINGATDRVFRVSNTSATVKVTGNTVVAKGDADGGELLAINGTFDDSTLTNTGNSWNGQNDEVIVKTTNEKGYLVIKNSAN